MKTQTASAAALSRAYAPEARDEYWNRAHAVFEATVGARLARAGLDADDMELRIEVAEHPGRKNVQALRMHFPNGITSGSTMIIYADDAGTLSWSRTRKWLTFETDRTIARRAWKLAIVGQGLDTLEAGFEHRTLCPVFAGIAQRCGMTMDSLRDPTDGTLNPFGLYQIGTMPKGYAVTNRPVATSLVRLTDVPGMEIRMDHDRIEMYGLALSDDVMLLQKPELNPVLRIRRHSLPDSALLALAGESLSALVDSDHLTPAAMPTIKYVRRKASGTIEAVLKTGSDGRMLVADRS